MYTLSLLISFSLSNPPPPLTPALPHSCMYTQSFIYLVHSTSISLSRHMYKLLIFFFPRTLVLSGSFMSSVGTCVAGAVRVFLDSKEWLDCSSYGNGVSSGSRHEVLWGVSVTSITQCSINAFTGGLRSELLRRASCTAVEAEYSVTRPKNVAYGKYKQNKKSNTKTKTKLNKSRKKKARTLFYWPWFSVRLAEEVSWFPISKV